MAIQRAAGNAAVTRMLRAGPQLLAVQRLQFLSSFGYRVTVSDQKIATHSVSSYLNDPAVHWLVMTAGRTDLPLQWAGKTLFPAGWGTDTISAAIKHVFEHNGGWTAHGTYDEDATGTYQGIAITLRRKRGRGDHITSAWPTGPTTLNPVTEWATFNASMHTMNSWISYYTGGLAFATDPAAQKKLAQDTIAALWQYSGTSMWYYVRPTYEAAYQLYLALEQQAQQAALAAMSDEAKAPTTTVTRLKELQKALGEMLNSETYEAIGPILERIKTRLASATV